MGVGGRGMGWICPRGDGFALGGRARVWWPLPKEAPVATTATATTTGTGTTPPLPPIYTANGMGMLRRDADVYVLHLQGTREEMARQHGELLRDEIRKGVLPLMANFLAQQLKGESDILSRIKSSLVGMGLTGLSRYVARNAPAELRRELHKVAEAAGMTRRDADMALAVPDTMMWVLGMTDRLWRLRMSVSPTPRKGGVGFGCSGVVAQPSATADGHLLQARNLDYDGIGTFDKYPTVAFCKPVDGQAYVWIASAGVHSAALTGMNESGIFLGSNTSPTTDVSLRGMPFLAVNDEVVRQATNLDEAVAILNRRTCVSGYNVVLSHGPSGESIVVEYSANHLGIRKPLGGCLAATNHYLSQDTIPTIPHVSLVDTVNTRKRYAQLRRKLADGYGSLTVDDLISFMRAQHEHPTGEPHPLGDVVCNYLNISSVVADVTARQLWTTCDSAPSALGRYVMFDLTQELTHFGQPRAYPLQVKAADPFRSTPDMDGVRAYKRAHQAHSYKGDHADAYVELERARVLLPQEPRIVLSLALMALRTNQLADAERHAVDYLAMVEDWDSRRYRAHLVRAWCLQLQGHDDAARCQLAEARRQSPHMDDADWEIRYWSGRRFTHNHRKQLHVELFNAKRLLV
jgi:Acyl-coenzyme A:6-aminopenicillanic acid acyl-transferase